MCDENDESAFRKDKWRTVETLVPIVSKIYAMIGVTSMLGKGDAGKVKMKEGKGEAKTDFCKFIPMGLEMAALATQKANNNQTLQNYQKAKPEAEQKASFEALAKMHTDKAKQSQIQAIGWYSTAGCYATYALTGAAMDAMMIAKLAGSTLIGTFYAAKENNHKQKAKGILNMAAKVAWGGRL